jgi:hypothetical protein
MTKVETRKQNRNMPSRSRHHNDGFGDAGVDRLWDAMTVVHGFADGENEDQAHQLGFRGVASRGWGVGGINLIGRQPISLKQPAPPAKLVPGARQR